MTSSWKEGMEGERRDELRRTQESTRKWWKKRPSPGEKRKSALGAVLRPFKAAVSTQNTRFMEDGFDLDLAYVTKRIIAHGIPNASADPLHKDPRTEVRRLLDKYHFDRYKMYNFATDLAQMTLTEAEQGEYARVERYPFTDDTCPPLESVVEFCENAKTWLDAHEENVVSLHCKAGKGKAWIMAACLMVRMGETAQEAVASYDATQASDLRHRTEENHRAWVFLYERLIREVWRLRDTTAKASDQNLSFRALPRLTTNLREVSLQLETPPIRRRWRQILHKTSCAVYQQTPEGKVLVHRAKMPSVYSRKTGQVASVFAATLPRSIVVDGTFQVVVSAATGIFGLGKNVLDVWCNTTLLGEDDGREIFTFTENDLPPGSLAKRLLEARVCVILTHTHPNAATPTSRRTINNWEGMDAVDTGRDTNVADDALTLVGPLEHSTTPETEVKTSDDSRGTESVTGAGVLAVRGAGVLAIRDSNRAATPVSRSNSCKANGHQNDRYYFSSDEKPSPREIWALQIPPASVSSVRSSSALSPWNLRVTVPQIVAQVGRTNSGLTTPQVYGGFNTPLSGTARSPLRSCPRARVSSRNKEKLNEKSERVDELAVAQRAIPRAQLRWASFKKFNPPARAQDILTPTSSSGEILGSLESRSQPAGTSLGPVEPTTLVVPTPRDQGGSLRRRSAEDVGEVEGGAVRSSSGIKKGKRKKLWASGRGESIRLDKVALRANSHGGGRWAGTTKDSTGRREFLPDDSEFEIAGGGLKRANFLVITTAVEAKAKVPPPDIKLMLKAAAMRSFEELQSPRTSSFFGSETGRSESGGGVEGSFSDDDGEKATLAARVLAGWVDSGIRPPQLDLVPVSGVLERGLVTTEKGATTPGRDTDVEGDKLESMPSLKARGWPPPKPVVAGEIEIQGALLVRADDHTSRRESLKRKGGRGMSWGEGAKLALARKRLEWEKSRRSTDDGNRPLRLHASLVAKREAELLAIETDVKEAVRVLEEKIARKESAEAALKKWRRQLPPKAYNDVISCLQGSRSFGLHTSD